MLRPKIYSSSDDIVCERQPGMGYVYVVAKSMAGPLKIGIAANPRSRAKELECANGQRFERIWVSSQCFNFRVIERRLHEQLDQFRLVGEWFDLPFTPLVEAIGQKCKFRGMARKKRMAALADAAAKVKPPDSSSA